MVHCILLAVPLSPPCEIQVYELLERTQGGDCGDPQIIHGCYAKENNNYTYVTQLSFFLITVIHKHQAAKPNYELQDMSLVVAFMSLEAAFQ